MSETLAPNHSGSSLLALVVLMDKYGKVPNGPPPETWNRPIVQLIVEVPGQKEPKRFQVGIPVEIDKRLYQRVDRWIQDVPSGIVVDTTMKPRPGEICCTEVMGLGDSRHRFKLVLMEHLKLTRRTVLIGVVGGAWWEERHRTRKWKDDA